MEWSTPADKAAMWDRRQMKTERVNRIGTWPGFGPIRRSGPMVDWACPIPVG